MNSVKIFGNLGKDPEVKELGDDKKLCKFSIATTRRWGGEKHTCWHNICAFGKQAELIAKYFAKGSPILIEGRIDNSTYEKDGEKKYRSEIIVENFHFVGSKADNDKPAVKNYADDIPFDSTEAILF